MIEIWKTMLLVEPRKGTYWIGEGKVPDRGVLYMIMVNESFKQASGRGIKKQTNTKHQTLSSGGAFL